MYQRDADLEGAGLVCRSRGRGGRAYGGNRHVSESGFGERGVE